MEDDMANGTASRTARVGKGDGDLSVQLRQEVQSLRKQLQRAQRLAQVGTLTAMVAHEFNNILTPMMNYAQLAQSDPALRPKAIRHALDGAARATAICRAILDLAAPDGEPRRTVRLADLVEETLTAMARDPGKDGIRLVRKVPPRLRLTTRPVELKQVLLNLILNARSAVMKKPRPQGIAISARRCGPKVFIRVADTGVGIAPEDFARIFEPFFTTNNGNGTGLGLAVCRHLVRSMNGRLTVRSQLGKGSCFTVALPVRAPAAGAGGKKVSATSSVCSPRPRTSRRSTGFGAREEVFAQSGSPAPSKWNAPCRPVRWSRRGHR
jgi:signal transduction histidine kinase